MVKEFVCGCSPIAGRHGSHGSEATSRVRSDNRLLRGDVV